jgi:hypothetical protein
MTMVALTAISAGNLEDIARACQASDVKRLDLFGSCARQDSTRDSDMDFLVEFNEPLRAGLFDRFLALHQELERITGSRVDLLECSSLENPVLRQRIQRDRKLIYAA